MNERREGVEAPVAGQGRRPAGWMERNWKWFVPIGCLGLLALTLGFLAAVISLIFWGIRSTDVYSGALERARFAPAVVEELGEPIEPGFWVTGSIHTSGPSGDVELMFPIAGPRGRGTIYVTAHKRAGRWVYDLLELEIDGREERIDFLDPPGEAAGLVPLLRAGGEEVRGT